MPLELQYDPSLLCLLARGWAVAKVHMRGGGELGRGWHIAGCRHRKRAAVDDCLAALRLFLAAGPHPGPTKPLPQPQPLSETSTAASPSAASPPPLSTSPGDGGRVGTTTAAEAAVAAASAPVAAAAVAAGCSSPLTAPGLVAGHAISAGGVVLGSALNAAPGVFGAAVLRCAFLELLGSCTDASQPLTAHEWDEWGDPADPRDMAALTDLCPYRNLEPHPHPHRPVGGGGGGDVWRAAVLASCAEEDPRVHPSIPAKWVARLRERLRRTHPLELYDKDADDGRTRATGPRGGDPRGSPWSRLLGRLWSGSTADATTYGDAYGSGPGPADTEEVGGRGRGRTIGASTGMAGWGSRGGASGGDGGRGVCAPLLRVYSDGGGHVREGHAAQAEEVVEEMAFLLLALGCEGEREGVGGAHGRGDAGGGK
ncbi:hypothetical protein PLESTM_000633500 [Pleodorina starrii]|nr:hypothetical protein PLESTM_000633500 [Pleodorina starrii]